MRTSSIPIRVVLAWLLASLPASAENTRQPVAPYLGGVLPATPPVPSGDWVTAKAFPRLTFEDPVGLVAAPEGNTLYVCGRQGVVWAFENDPNVTTKTVFLDIRARCQGWDDGGLLGLAFHPRFGKPGAAERGYVYVWYTFSESPTPGPGRPPNSRPTSNRLARFTVPDGAAVADPNSELVLIDQLDENTYHNGGGLFFHPGDGFLYLSLGDEGTDGNTQRIDKDLFSGVIRIDVDCRGGAISHPPPRAPETGQTAHYFIPNDNPWVGVPEALEEFWCVGLRSPHRMTYDPVGRQIWAGDVGESSREEIDVIERGGNYQWKYREGTLRGPDGRPAQPLGAEKPPIFEYGHDQGRAVIGGYVYRGAEHAASLGGKYLFGDNSGRVWALTYDNGPPRVERLCELPEAPSRAYGLGLSSFGIDRTGEVYLCQLGTEGQIYRLARKGVDTAGGSFPRLLSRVGAFRDLRTLQPAPGLTAYEVNAPLWADGADKSRWVAVPNDGPPYGTGERVGFSTTGGWTFPDGTVFVKHFEIATDETHPGPKRRLETRFLVRSAGGGVHGVTYRWRDDQSDAELVGEDGRDEGFEITTSKGKRRQTWHYPSRRECLSCHTPAAGYVLGVNTRQLNRDVTDPDRGGSDNQIGSWARLGLLEPAPADRDLRGLPRLVAVNETRAALGERARSYLDANCAHCHRPGGVRASFDARYDAPEPTRDLIGGAVANSLGLADARVIASGAPGRSVAYKRITSLLAAERMPPLATSVVDADASDALREWIEGLPASPRVHLARPSDRMIVKAGADVMVEAQVTPGAGAVRGVEFYRGTDRLGDAATSPYRVIWKAAAAGSYALTARVRDDRGDSAASGAVMVTVVEPPQAETQEPGRVYLSDLPWSDASSGWGPVEKDRSNGEKAAGDGGTIRLNGRRHAKGLGVHAGSVVRYRLKGEYAAFLAQVGVDDEVGDGGSVVFQVWADGTKVFDSGLMTGRSAARSVNVEVSRREELRLVVTDGGDGDSSDHADWANARLIPAAGRTK